MTIDGCVVTHLTKVVAPPTEKLAIAFHHTSRVLAERYVGHVTNDISGGGIIHLRRATVPQLTVIVGAPAPQTRCCHNHTDKRAARGNFGHTRDHVTWIWGCDERRCVRA
jgi:hypothetical protein